MAITLNGIALDRAHTQAKEKVEEVGGRDARIVELTGLILGESTVAAIEARLDAIVQAASREDYSAALSIRDGRRLWVRREAFTRALDPETLVGSFTLKLAARDPLEETIEEHVEPWTIAASGSAIALTTAGDADAQPVVTLAALDELLRPALSDGMRTVTYDGIVPAASTIAFDSRSGRVLVDGEDVTPYTTGLLPRIPPGGATFTYTGDPTASHIATANIRWHDRWC